MKHIKTFENFLNEAKVDMNGKVCKKCKKGKYKETSQMDDLKGVLHCDKCGEETERYINESVVNETYYNKEWNLTNIQSWITTYANENRLNLKLVHTATKNSGNSKSKTTFYVYDLGDKFGIVIIDSKVEGAPRLSDIEVAVGVKGSAVGSLTKSFKISDSSEKDLADTINKVTK